MVDTLIRSFCYSVANCRAERPVRDRSSVCVCWVGVVLRRHPKQLTQKVGINTRMNIQLPMPTFMKIVLVIAITFTVLNVELRKQQNENRRMSTKMFKNKKTGTCLMLSPVLSCSENITRSPKQKNKKNCPLANDLSLKGIREDRQNHTQTHDITSLSVLAKFLSGF